MKYFYIVSFLTVILLIGIYSVNQNIFQIDSLPYDAEQEGIDSQITIHFSHVVAENTPKGLAATKFAELVKEKTNGQVIVQVYPNGILYNDSNEFEALKNNDVQMIAPTFSKVSALLPSWEILDLPFIIQNDEQLETVLNSELKDLLLQELEQKNMKGLQFWSNGFKQIAANDTSVLTTQDFSSLRIRVMDSAPLKELMALLGATPISTTFDDVFNEIESNTINAQENTISNIYSKGFHTYEKHITLSNHGIMGYAVIMNEAFWETLPKHIQLNIQDALQEMQKWQFEQSVIINNKSLQALKDIQDVYIYTPSFEQLDEWRKTLLPLYKSYQSKNNNSYYSLLVDDILKNY